MEGVGRGSKISVFVHAQGLKTVDAGGWGVKKWPKSVHVVVECPLLFFYIDLDRARGFKKAKQIVIA